MAIKKIYSMHEFMALRENWRKVYRADTHAHYFLAWEWLRGYLSLSGRQWFILAYRPDDDGEFVAFLPLAMTEQFGGNLKTLEMAGNPESDYTGFLCLPEHTDVALYEFSKYVQNSLNWDRFHLRDVRDERLNLFLQQFPGEQFEISPREELACPYIPLPERWEDYLQMLSRNSRWRVRRAMRRVDRLPNYRYLEISTETYDEHFRALTELWAASWGDPPYDFGKLLRCAFKEGHVWLGTIWSGDKPVAALAGLVDRQKKRFYNLLGAFNRDFQEHSPGKALHATSIKFAIEQGLQAYDYLRGDEPYKYRLGAVDAHNVSQMIQRRTLKNIAYSFGKSARQQMKKWKSRLSDTEASSG